MRETRRKRETEGEGGGERFEKSPVCMVTVIKTRFATTKLHFG